MRTYGRVLKDPLHPEAGFNWVVVTTTPDGYNDFVYLTALVQVLKLNLNESPFYANFGLPAKQSVLQQVFPDYYVAFTQQQFAAFFASLIVSKETDPTPTYRINVTTHQGVKLNASVPIPT
jgi:hypothetical protein